VGLSMAERRAVTRQVEHAVGYRRDGTDEELNSLNALYDQLRLMINDFTPSAKTDQQDPRRREGHQALRHPQEALPAAPRPSRRRRGHQDRARGELACPQPGSDPPRDRPTAEATPRPQHREDHQRSEGDASLTSIRDIPEEATTRSGSGHPYVRHHASRSGYVCGATGSRVVAARSALAGVCFRDEKPRARLVLARDEDADTLGELKLRIKPAPVVGRRRGADSVGLEHSDDQLRLDQRRDPSDDCGEAGHGASMAATPADVERMRGSTRGRRT
jgi:hypothetical protein